MSSSELKVRVLYDFQAQPSSGELSVHTDEILTVTRQDVGEGWWEGVNARGESGLFPAGYVEDWGDDDSQTSDYHHVNNHHSEYGSNVNTTNAGYSQHSNSYNRFSTFVKSGGEDYILGVKNKSVTSDNYVYVVQDSDGTICWSQNEHLYTVNIASPEKESKLKGFKSFIAYK
ncbi:sorting nexin-9-like protein, partial [Dinothrombium tinctorium]